MILDVLANSARYEGLHEGFKKALELWLFIERYRDLIIDARITGNMANLYNHIGKGNFEELNDILDYIDMLIEMGLPLKLNNKCMEDKLVLEYINELKKLSNVYADMDDHYKSYVSNKIKIK